MKENPKYPYYDENCYTFFGTKGSLAFPSFNLYSYDDQSYGWEYPLITEKLDVEDNDPMTAELLHFVDVLKGETDPIVTGEDGLEALKVINAVKISARKKKKIYIDSTVGQSS